MTRNDAIKTAQIVRMGSSTYQVTGAMMTTETKHPSISAAKRYVRESKLRCVAQQPGEKPSVLNKVRTHLGHLQKEAQNGKGTVGNSPPQQ